MDYPRTHCISRAGCLRSEFIFLRSKERKGKKRGVLKKKNMLLVSHQVISYSHLWVCHTDAQHLG